MRAARKTSRSAWFELVMLFVLVLGVVGEGWRLMAQTAAETPPQATITPLHSSLGAAVEVPAGGTMAETKEIATQATKDAQAEVKGDTTMEEITRSAADTPDPGSSGAFWIAVPVIGGLLRRVVDAVVRLIPHIDNDLSGALHGLVMIALGTLGWFLARSVTELPQDWLSWFNAAMSATAGGVFVSTKATDAVKAATGQFKTRDQEWGPQ